MGLSKALRWGGFGALVLLAGCGGMDDGGAPEDSFGPGRSDAEVTAPADAVEAAPTLTLHDGHQVQATPPVAPLPVQFQPGFHQALRESTAVGSFTTYRMKVPVGRAGSRVRVTFRSGDGGLTLQRATVAKAGAGGALASTPVALTFGGNAGFTTGTRTLVTSDPVSFPVAFGDEVAISFEVKGALGQSRIQAFPDSWMRTGAYATAQGALGGQAWEFATGVATLDVEGTPGRAFVTIGDSITEGYMDTRNDTRNAWSFLVQKQLGVPVVNSGASGQGFWDANLQLPQEVLPLKGVTDCIVLLGVNDLAAEGMTVPKLQQRMTQLLDQLQPMCRLWVSTLLPKEKMGSEGGDVALMMAQRHEFNAWIRGLTRADVIDLESVMHPPGNVDLFLEGLEQDGIHPNAAGHRLMANEVVRVLKAKGGL
ncbi:SGNH/GDSL hydrolase family protein [Corallococcus carmarthensis]|uniref:SGNH/GDSL hydrolase family protein n=1 Tax=Corallococcus carmarthensis TaxID=2316728 RepID=A0A3A8K262_9BACT|nr:SGNH/GDSL hydrolase family protein [Corallococcus carmarthensis]NOK21444.1 SGNH/GDSL hydrolase family protein [Corallococcus carmarthensis]RKG98544.1 SGNH/GDSL hydrolase family protein [Corallococcus carmarthensis]